MIKEITKNKRYRDLVTRICDECGIKEQKTLEQILLSHSHKKQGKDYCKNVPIYIEFYQGVKVQNLLIGTVGFLLVMEDILDILAIMMRMV